MPAWLARHATRGDLVYYTYLMAHEARDTLVNALVAVPLELGFFFRGTTDATEPTRPARFSRNHLTGELEHGLSVASHPGYAVRYPWVYIVAGRVAGRGSDGEPLLDPLSVRALTKAQRTPPAKYLAKWRAATAHRDALIARIEAATLVYGTPQGEPVKLVYGPID